MLKTFLHKKGAGRAPMTLYYHPGATSFAVHVILRELGFEFALRKVDLNKNEQRSSAFLRVNPRGRVPVLDIDDETLTETPAILTALAMLRPEAGLMPQDGLPQARALEWLSWLSSTVHISFAQVFFPARFSADPADAPALESTARAALEGHFDDINRRILSPWALGEIFSVVDPYLLVFCRFADLLALGLSPDRVRLLDWRDRALKRKSVIAAMEAEGVAMSVRKNA